jgi:hypothetical protein
MVDLAFVMLSFMYLLVGESIPISDFLLLLQLVDPVRMVDRDLLSSPLSRQVVELLVEACFVEHHFDSLGSSAHLHLLFCGF